MSPSSTVNAPFLSTKQLPIAPDLLQRPNRTVEVVRIPPGLPATPKPASSLETLARSLCLETPKPALTPAQEDANAFLKTRREEKKRSARVNEGYPFNLPSGAHTRY